jgi:hypothetical protein
MQPKLTFILSFFFLQSLVVLTQVPQRLIERQFTLKRKDCETDDTPGITATTMSEDDLSGQETELDDVTNATRLYHFSPIFPYFS